MSTTPAEACPVGPNPNSNPCRHKEDRSRWLSLKEESLFLNDGLLRSVGLLPNPFDKKDDIFLGRSSSVEFDMEGLLKIGASDPEELQDRLFKLCRASALQLRSYAAFQFTVLTNMWRWKQRDGKAERNSQTFIAVNSSSTALLSPKKKNLGSGNMSSRLSLILMVPLLKSQATTDPELAATTAALLLEMLAELPPMSLSKELTKPLDHLERLLEQWIAEQGSTFESIGSSTMIGLCCGRGVLSSFLKTIQIVQAALPAAKLPVRKILKKLPGMKVRIGQPCALIPANHLKTVPYDDRLVSPTETNSPGEEGNEADVELPSPNWHLVATNGDFMYVSGGKGRGMSKIGTGLHGTIQGYVYNFSQRISAEFMALGNNMLIIGPHPDLPSLQNSESAEPDKIALAALVDLDTLAVKSAVWIQTSDDLEGDYKVIGLTSDGYNFYMLRVLYPEKETGQEDDTDPGPSRLKRVVSVFLDTFQVVESGKGYFFYPVRPRELLIRDEDGLEQTTTFPEPRRSRSIRLAVGSVNARLAAAGVVRPLDPAMERLTSLGIRMKHLISASMFSCGNYLTLLTEVPPGPPPGFPQSPIMSLNLSLNRHFGTTINGLHSPKLGTQIQISLNGKKRVYTKQAFSDPPVRSSFLKAQVSLSQVAVTYDAKNNLIWSVSGDYMDAWRNPGHTPPWFQHAQLMIHQTEVQEDSGTDLEAFKVLNHLWTHVGVMASHFLSGDPECDIGFTTSILKELSDATLKNVRTFDGTALTAVLLVFQAVVSQITTPSKEVVRQFKEIQTLVLVLLSDSKFTSIFECDPSFGVYYEASKLFLMIFEYVYRTVEKRETFIREMLEWMDEDEELMRSGVLKVLKQILLKQFTMKIEEPAMTYMKGKKWILSISNMNKFIGDSVQATMETFDGATERRSSDRALEVPVAHESTLYVTAVGNCILRSWNSGRNIGDDRDKEMALSIIKSVLNHSSTIVDRAIEFLSAQDAVTFQSVTSTENILKSSLLGLAVPQMFLSFAELSSSESLIIEELSEESVQLYVAISHLNDLCHQWKDSSEDLSPSEDWASEIRKPFPFQHTSTCESNHPVRDSSKIRETLLFPGARRLYLKFDPRCATQYDYDKLTLYAGLDTNSKVVMELGGNFYGYGNRNGNPGYWPRDLVRVDGEALTYNFEVRSGREQHSPEQALWGFAFTVFPVFDSNAGQLRDGQTEKKLFNGRLAPKQHTFLENLTLGSLDLVSRFISKLSTVEPRLPLEQEIEPLFSIEILAHLQWASVQEFPGPYSLSPANIKEMRKIAHNAVPPKMSGRMSAIIKPEEFQPLYVQLCLKCLQKDKVEVDYVQEGGSDVERPAYDSNPDLLHEIFRGADAILRHLMALTEMQFRFSAEVDDFVRGVKSLSEAFFFDPSFDESELINLAIICELTFDKEEPGNTRNDISAIVEAFMACDSAPDLTKAQEVVGEIFSRMRHLLAAEKRPGSEHFWDCRNFKRAKGRVDQVHTYVGYPLANPAGTLSNAVKVLKGRQVRATNRSQGTQLLLKLMECSKHFSQSLIVSGLLLQQCVELRDVLCTGYEQELTELSGRIIKAVVDIASKNPPVYRYAIALLCILPYERRDENCLVESGLLELLDQLCACQVSDPRPKPEKSGKGESDNVGPLAWSAFQVLADRCSSWETSKSNDFEWIETDHIALPIQISVNVTNHLARATAFAALSSVGGEESDRGSGKTQGSAPSLTESIQDVLGLLDTLQSSKLGRAILKQGPCISRLLSLLLDPRLSPRLVLTILRLLVTALPLVNTLDIADLNSIPMLKKRTVVAGTHSNPSEPNAYSIVASLLLSKLADFLVIAGHSSPPSNGSPVTKPTLEALPASYRAVWFHKKAGESFDPQLTTLLLENDAFPRSLSPAQFEAELSRAGKIQLLAGAPDIAKTIFQKLLILGLNVTMTPVVKGNIQKSPSSLPRNPGPSTYAGPPPPPPMPRSPTRAGSKKVKPLSSDQTCKERNSYLVSHDPARSFLSGTVAEGLAAQIIRLLRLLLATATTLNEESKASSSSTSKGNLSATSSVTSSAMSEFEGDLEYVADVSRLSPWATAVEEVLCSALKPIAKLAGLCNPGGISVDSYSGPGRLVIGALSVLGSFNETVRVGAQVWILSRDDVGTVIKEKGSDDDDWAFHPTKVLVLAVCNRTSIATVRVLPTEAYEHEPITPSSTLEVPISRLSSERFPKWDVLPRLSLSAQREIAGYLRGLFVPHAHAGTSKQADGMFPLRRPLPTLAHILASANQPTNPTPSVPSSAESRAVAHGMTAVRLVAEIRTRSSQALSLWLRRREFVQIFLGLGSEMEFGKSEGLPPDSLAAVISMKSLAKESKASHRLQNVESQVTRLRLLHRDCTKPSKLVSPSQPPHEEPRPGPPQTTPNRTPNNPQPTAVIGSTSETGFFRLRRIAETLQEFENNISQFYPFLGDIESESEVSFAVAETGSEDGVSSEYGSPQSSSTAINHYVLQEELESEAEMVESDSSEADGVGGGNEEEGPPFLLPLMQTTEAVLPVRNTQPIGPKDAGTQTGRQAPSESQEPAVPGRVAKPRPESKEYAHMAILDYHLTPSASYDIRVFTGPNRYVCPCSLKLESESDLLVRDEAKTQDSAVEAPPAPRSARTADVGTNPMGSDGTEDVHDLLVRAWETRVFPTIRRRFRNESERRDGLEQIRGALTMGMLDIARQTVEFLYEENGGLPRDLHLPTLEEIKAEASRFTLQRIKVGMSVMIRPVRPDDVEDVGGSIIPKYAVGPMLKTFGLLGEVLEVDPANELVLVETYVETEGNLLRFWYPLKCLEKLGGSAKPLLSAHTVNMFKLHSNLVTLEGSLSQLYCRTAFLQILNNCNEEDCEGSARPTKSSTELEQSGTRSLMSTLEELDLENLQLRSEHGFSDFPLNGDLLTWNLGFGAPPMKFLTDMGNPSSVFYRNCTKLTQELRCVIERAGSRGLESLSQLTSQICAVIENAPNKFVTEDIPMDKEGEVDIYLPDTAFTMISVRSAVPTKSPPLAASKEPCVHVYGMNGGDLKKYALACYPIQSLSYLQKGNLNLAGRSVANSSSGNSSGNCTRECTKNKNAFPTILVPTDRINCSITNPALIGYSLQVQGIPPTFPLALLYCQELIEFIKTHEVISKDILSALVSMLFNFLRKTSMPPTLKEWIFMLLSQAMSVSRKKSFMKEFYLSETGLLTCLFTELVLLYEQETRAASRVPKSLTHGSGLNLSPQTPSTSTGTNPSALPGPSRIGPGINRSNMLSRARPVIALPIMTTLNRSAGSNTVPVKSGSALRRDEFQAFSSYFQSLMELCLNLSYVVELNQSPETVSPVVSTEVSPSVTPMRRPSGPISVTLGAQSLKPVGPLALQKKGRKPTSMKGLQKVPAVRKGGQTPRPDPKPSVVPLTEVERSLNECAEMSWFRSTRSAYRSLQFLSNQDFPPETSIEFPKLLLEESLMTLGALTCPSRLFVIIGAPNEIAGMTIETSIARGLNETGGIYGNEVWIQDGVDVVLEVRTACKADKAFGILKRNQTWYPIENFILYPSVSVHRVSNCLETGDRRSDKVLSDYLRERIFHPTSTRLSDKAEEALSRIFTKCYAVNDRAGCFEKEESTDESGTIILRKKHILNAFEYNYMAQFVTVLKPDTFEMDYFLHEVFKKFGQRIDAHPEKLLDSGSEDGGPDTLLDPTPVDNGLKKTTNTKLRGTQKKAEKPSSSGAKTVAHDLDDSWGLSESGFIGWCTELGRDNVCALWRAFLATGHDFRLDKVGFSDYTELTELMVSSGWTSDQDAALVNYIDRLAGGLRITPQSIHPHEIYLEEGALVSPDLAPLRGASMDALRCRFAVLEVLNRMVSNHLLPFVPLHIGRSMSSSIAALLHSSRYLLFYSTKEDYLNKVLLHSAVRGTDLSPPEVVLDPLKRIGATEVDSTSALFSQAICQLNDVPSSLFCVPPATGGDPPLPIIVKFSGEEVQGLIGSFRHFLGNAVTEFRKPELNMFMTCGSAAAGHNKDSCIIRPGPLSYGEEKLMSSFGQFIGICLRADAPVSLTLLRSTWRSLLDSTKERNDSSDDLQEADLFTASFLRAMELETDQLAFSEVLEEQDYPTFQYRSLDSSTMIPLCPAGLHLPVNYENRGQFVRLVRRIRNKELSARNRVSQILGGLGTLVPVPAFFTIFTSLDLELRVAGSPEVNLALLKAHTHYQVGISETDDHILFFWAVLESMTPEELKNFVKFGTNQERLPVTCPCQNLVGGPTNPINAVHVPPFPMKMAPIDMPAGATADYINKRTIRAETCLFLIRLPPYTSYQVTRDQLIFACNSRDDPLSG